MAITITRTADTDWNGIYPVTVGTVRNNAWKQALYDQIDTALAAIEAMAAPGITEVWIPAKDFFLDTTGPAAALATRSAGVFQDYQHIAFDGAAGEVIHAWWNPPKRWNRGTITYQVYWSGIVAGAGGVVWQLSGRAVSDDDTIASATGTAVDVTDTFIVADDLHISPVSAAVTIAGTPAANDMVRLQFQRNPSAAGDTRTQDANFIGLKLFVTMTANNDA